MDVGSLSLHTLVGTLNGQLTVYVRGGRRKLRWTIGPVREQNLTSSPDSRSAGPGPKRIIPMLQLTDSQQCTLSVEPVDKKGHKAPVDEASVTWSSSDEGVATVSGSGLSATVVAKDVGVCQINVSLDADTGEGTRQVAGSLDVTVVPGDAVSLNVKTETPTEQPT